MDIGSRQHHRPSHWTLHQLRETIPSDHDYRFVIHDRDSIFSSNFDSSLARLGVKAIRTPICSPKANAVCERLIGTLRRECLDWIIPLGESHLRSVLLSWMAHYNCGRPHWSLGPGIPEPRSDLRTRLQRHRHRLDRPAAEVARPILHGLHHEYRVGATAA